ncbi:MAG TPA: ROK family protein [Terracidiphilus sp.]
MARPESRVVVYDVGGSHISAAVFDREGCTVQGVVTQGYPAEQNIETFLGVLHTLGARAAQGQADIPGVSIAMPGPFDYERGVSWMQHKLPYLYGFDLRHALAARLGTADAQVRFLNDAAAFLLGEISAGSAQGVGRAVGITLGTGIGSAFAVDGLVIREGTGVPPGGEIWNFPYQGGILEDQISTRAIRKSYQVRTGEDREVAAIAASAAQDAVAAEVFLDFGRTLGTALRTVLGAFGPQVIVLGGGISRSAHLFLGAAQAELDTPRVELRVSLLGESAPLVGAGAAWFQTRCGISPAADDAGLHAVAKPI